MEATGEGKKKILIIAEAPGAEEDKRGIQLVGDAGTLFRRYLRSLGVDLDRDCWKTNAINCRPPGNRKPTIKEIEACRPRVWDVIENEKPRLIILCGEVAVESFLGHRWPKDLGTIGKWRGWYIPDRRTGAWVAPTYHPSYIMRSEKEPAKGVIFKGDLQGALNHLDIPHPPADDNIYIIREEQETIDYLKKVYMRGVKSPELISFDYETTGLKPHAPGHRIVCCAIGEAGGTTAFMITDKVKPRLKRVLREPDIPKTAHNMKFEESWSRVILNTPVAGWRWDSMLGAHVQNNRPYITGLKFQAYVNFGIEDYSSHLEPLLESKKNNANSFNKIDEIDPQELLLYCGRDALIQRRLALKQMEEQDRW
jgi:DNA polymerase